MPRSRTLVIVGGGLAGAKAAEGARSAGHDGRVVLVGEERHLPYERPPLSKGLLRGESDLDEAFVHPPSFYADNDIEVLSDVAEALDPVTRTVTLAEAGPLRFDCAVIATGAASRRLDVPGTDLHGVHYLRTAPEAMQLGEALRSCTRVAVIGAGWIGTEVAASARAMGADVVMIDPAPVPLQRVLGDELGAVFADLHAEHGVTLRLGVGVEAVVGSGRVEGVALSDGSVEHVDVVVIGIGVVPRAELLRGQTMIEVDNGIVVDEFLETAVEGIFAAGDVANAFHARYGRRLRVEHWANALNQGEHAGANTCRANQPYERLPYFFSDQYDLGLEYVGHAGTADRLVLRGDVAARRFVAIWHDNERVNAAMAVNGSAATDDLKALVSHPCPVDMDRLEDPGIELATLLT